VDFVKRYIKQLQITLISASPIVIIIFIVHFFISPMNSELLIPFIISVFILLLGQALFLLGVDGSILAMGELVGNNIQKLKTLPMILLFGFVFGTLATIAEPSVEILTKQAEKIGGINSVLLTWVVSTGIGIFVAYALLRVLRQLPLRLSFLIGYVIIFTLMFFTPPSFCAIAFDFSGATTGVITVPFILSIGVGVSAVLGKNSQDDSYGLIGIASMGPIITMAIMAIINGDDNLQTVKLLNEPVDFLQTMLSSFSGVLMALTPIVIIFLLFNFFFIHLPKSKVIQISVGVLFTLTGIGLFLTAVNYGFANAGQFIGQVFTGQAADWFKYLLIPFGFILGFALAYSEPAIHVLGTQIEDTTNGNIKKKVLVFTLAIGLGTAVMLAMLRVLFQINILFILIPIFVIAFALSPFIPRIFVGIAFDSGGVVSGTITGAFVVPFAAGACYNLGLGGDIIIYGFGVIALIATVPIVAISVLGLAYNIALRRAAEFKSEIWEHGVFRPYEKTNFIGIACTPKLVDEVVAKLNENGVIIMASLHAEGISKTPTSIMNFITAPRAFIIAMMPNDKADKFIDILEKELAFDERHAGIAFTGGINKIKIG
jgi:hypothetical protein